MNKTVKNTFIVAGVTAGVTGIAAGVLYLFFPNTYYKLKQMTTNNAVTVSPEGEAFTKAEEGEKVIVYLDTAGNGTVGWGHKVLPEDKLSTGDQISNEQMNAFWEKDKGIAVKRVNSALKVPVTQPIFDACFDFEFNTGVSKSTFYDLLNSGDLKGAADFLEHHYITDSAGNALTGLVKRRTAEATEIIS